METIHSTFVLEKNTDATNIIYFSPKRHHIHLTCLQLLGRARAIGGYGCTTERDQVLMVTQKF